MMKNNYSAMMAFFLLIVSGCMMSPDGWGAGATVTMKRPGFSMKRTPGTNNIDIIFKSTKSVSVTLEGISTISANVRYGGSGPLYETKIFVDGVNVDCTKNESACSNAISKLLGNTYSMTVRANDKGSCVMVGNLGIGIHYNTVNDWVSSSGISCTVMPPVDCVGDDCDIGEGEKPKPDLSCSVKTSSINLAFGNMAMGEALNKTVSSKINVNCNKAGAKLTMSLKGGGSSIDLSNGMTAKLTAGGKSLGSSISAAKGDNNITILGALDGTEKEGTFSGSGVLVTNYQ